MTAVNRKTETGTRRATLATTSTPLLTVRTPSEESLDEQDLWCATDDKTECEAVIGLREAKQKLQHAKRREGSARRVTMVVNVYSRTDQHLSKS